jgi:hypothetical protein
MIEAFDSTVIEESRISPYTVTHLQIRVTLRSIHPSRTQKRFQPQKSSTNKNTSMDKSKPERGYLYEATIFSVPRL